MRPSRLARVLLLAVAAIVPAILALTSAPVAAVESAAPPAQVAGPITTAGLLGPAAAQEASACPDLQGLAIPEAEAFTVTCLGDLTTLGNPRVDQNAAAGGGSRSNPILHSKDTNYTDDPVPGIQIDGFFPDSCDNVQGESTSFVPRCSNGLRRNGQFAIRIPNAWDGEHLVVAGTPGVRGQFASDIIISDYVLARGWAYATQDKGNTGLNFFRSGPDEGSTSPTTWTPPKAIDQWADYMGRTAVAAKAVLADGYGRAPSRTYATGISNGGYQTRMALERFPELFDGGVDWEGTLLQPDAPNLLTYIPPLLRHYPTFRATHPTGTDGGGSGSTGPGFVAGASRTAVAGPETAPDDSYRGMVHEGRVPPDSESIWDNHYQIYWGFVASTYRPVFDPEYTGYVASPREVLPQDPDAQYDYTTRPAFVRERLAEVANTGDIHGRKLLTLHGTLDALLPIDTDSDRYAEMVQATGNGANHRYYVIEGGTHVDKLADDHPEVFRPILPCYLEALDELDAWVTEDAEPRPSGFVEFPADTTPKERAQGCELPPVAERIAGPDRVQTAIAASRGTFGITETVTVASARDFPDALAAGPLAGSLDGPLLLVDDEVTDELRRELFRLGALGAVIVGGPDAVSAEVEAQLADAGLATRRAAGGDRYATAAAVAAELGAPTGEAFVASGERFPDALTAVPVAASSQSPILLVEQGAVPTSTHDALAALGVERTVVVGGPVAVSDEVARALPSATRVAGLNRYQTSVAVAELGLERGHTLDSVLVATGGGFADALVGGPVAVKGYGGAPAQGLVLLIEDDAAAGDSVVVDFLSEHAQEVHGVVVLGSDLAVSAQAQGRLAGTVTTR